MNEQIRLLAEQAELNLELQSLKVEKFAELLIQQCISAVDSTPLGYGDYRDQIEKAMRNACSQAIRNTFGVEE